MQSLDANNGLITFDSPVTFDDGVTPDAAFQVEGSTIDHIYAITADSCAFFAGDGVGVGASWEMLAQPNWITTTIHQPDSGTAT